MTTSSIPTSDHEARVREIQQDLFRLAQHYTETQPETELDEALLDRAVRAMRIEAATVQEPEEEEIWRVRTMLARLTRPATPAGLRLLALIENGNRPLVSPLNEARRFKRWGGTFLVVFLALMVFVHVYLFVLSTLIANADKSARGFVYLEHEVGKLSGLPTAAAAAPGVTFAAVQPGLEYPPADGEALPEPAPRPAAIVAQTAKAVCEKARANGSRLLTMTTLGLSKLRYDPARELECEVRKESLDIDFNRVQATALTFVETQTTGARLTRKAVIQFLLPMLYGALGAYVFALRQIVSRAEQGNLTSVARFRYRVRLLLGAVFGLTVATLLGDEVLSRFFTGDGGGPAPLPNTVVAVSQAHVVIAFLSGYSVEAVFGVLDFAIDRIRTFVEHALGGGGASPTAG